MALSAKILAGVAVLGGGGIAIPVYLKSRGERSPALKAQAQESTRHTPETPARANPITKSVEQVSCDVSEVTPEKQNLNNWSKVKSDSWNLYSFVSCTNPSVTRKEDSYFGKKWEGLFPTNVLSENLSYQKGEKFALSATTVKVEESNSDNEIPFTTFSNIETGKAIRGKWDLGEGDFEKQVIVIALEGINQKEKKVYILTNPTALQTSDQV